MSSDETWRVYLPEWLVVYTSDGLGSDGQEECLRHFTGKYQGRVRVEDWRVVPGIFGVDLHRSPFCLQLCVPNLRGEFKDRDDAWERKYSFTVSPLIVQRSSPEERAILDYSRKMLSAPAGGKGKLCGSRGSRRLKQTGTELSTSPPWLFTS